ncbi:hypothetical protein H1P_4530003 [Hyella patelloides LEGE 07179]|uniref:Uncharacterized protein n=1 Tax=Hyella patelloides LEGE 07179 TaxID=945734 RepID=A0A563VYM4_9CYAN|nr:hypothetical protein H1P_4530003 [Hyella patelloides LEGE 07179]
MCIDFNLNDVALSSQIKVKFECINLSYNNFTDFLRKFTYDNLQNIYTL